MMVVSDIIVAGGPAEMPVGITRQFLNTKN
jgi:hypothetical protein